MPLPVSLRMAPLFFLSLAGSFAQSFPAVGPAWEPIPFLQSSRAFSLFSLGDRVWIADIAGLHESSDGGESWRTVEQISSRPTHGVGGTDSFLVVVKGQFIYRSTDSGKTWLPAKGTPNLYPEGGFSFRAQADSLFLEPNSSPGSRMASTDQGRTWISVGHWSEPAPAIQTRAFAGTHWRLAGGILAQSKDGGASWEDLPWQAPMGEPVSLAEASGKVYVLSSGLVWHRREAATWEVLHPSSQTAVVRQMAASGNNLCVSTDLGVTCSRDGGRHFRTLGCNPFPASRSGEPKKILLGHPFSIAVDQDRVYLSSLDYYGPNHLWTRPLADTGSWSRIDFSPAYPAFNLTMAANQGMLVLFEGLDSLVTRISADQGRTFRELPPRQKIPNIRLAAVSGSHWALVAGFELMLSVDSGKTWSSQPYRGDSTLLKLSLTDSAVYTGGKYRYSLGNASWSMTDVSEPILAATDSALYAGRGGTLWVLRSMPIPVFAQHRRQPSRPIPLRDDQGRDILGKLVRGPARGIRFGRPASDLQPASAAGRAASSSPAGGSSR